MIEYANVMICYHSHHSTLGQAKAYKYSVWYKLEIYLVLWAASTSHQYIIIIMTLSTLFTLPLSLK